MFPLLAEQHLNKYQEWAGFSSGVESAAYLLKVDIQSDPLFCGSLHHVSKFESLLCGLRSIQIDMRIGSKDNHDKIFTQVLNSGAVLQFYLTALQICCSWRSHLLFQNHLLRMVYESLKLNINGLLYVHPGQIGKGT